MILLCVTGPNVFNNNVSCYDTDQQRGLNVPQLRRYTSNVCPMRDYFRHWPTNEVGGRFRLNPAWPIREVLPPTAEPPTVFLSLNIILLSSVGLATPYF